MVVDDPKFNPIRGDFAADLRSNGQWKAIGPESICDGFVDASLVDKVTKKPIEPPQSFKDEMEKLFVEPNCASDQRIQHVI